MGRCRPDPLLAQDLAYAAALQAAGVPTVLREYPDELCHDLRTVLVRP